MSHFVRSSSLIRHAARSCVRSVNGSFSRVSVQPNPVANPSLIASNLRSFSSATDNLSALLAREYDEEVENSLTSMPAELATLKETLEKDWKIVDDDAVTKMYRTAGSVKLQVNFHCQDTVQVVDEYVEEEVEGEEAADPVRFTVTATKAGKTLVFTCISENAQARVQSVAVTSDDLDAIQANSGVSSSQYQGPDFGELAEDLQDGFHAYLEEDVGLNEDVASFIAMYTDYKEEQNYVLFLMEAKSLLE